MQSAKKTTPVKDGLRDKALVPIESHPKIEVDQRAIAEGRKPLATRRKDVAALKAKALELYSFPDAGLAALPAIDAGFKFSPLESDAELNDLPVESLLDESAALLARCAEARSQRDQLLMERWKLQIELANFFRLDEVEERERQAGLDTLSYERAALESGAESTCEANHKSSEAALKDLTDDLIASGFNKRMAARELSAWVAAFPLKDSELGGDDAHYTFDGVQKTKPNHLFEAARMEADQAAWEQIAYLLAQRYTAMAASEAGRLRKESLNLQTKWALAEIAFRRERSQMQGDAFWEKVYQAQSPGGLFNYAERIGPMERRFSSDFREALARLTAAQTGLKELYGYAAPFPQEATAGYFDDVAVWVRTAKAHITQSSQRDQNYVLAVSVKDLAKSQWETGRASAQWTFDLPGDLFADQAHVRLRGIGLVVVGDPEADEPALPIAAQKSKAGQKGEAPPPPKLRGFWSARIALPPTATIRHASGASVERDQRALPVCFIGRVADRDSSHQAEIAGGPALHDASPIGKQWKLTLSPKSTDGTMTADLHDVQLYLHVAVRDLKAQG